MTNLQKIEQENNYRREEALAHYPNITDAVSEAFTDNGFLKTDTESTIVYTNSKCSITLRKGHMRILDKDGNSIATINRYPEANAIDMLKLLHGLDLFEVLDANIKLVIPEQAPDIILNMDK